MQLHLPGKTVEIETASEHLSKHLFHFTAFEEIGTVSLNRRCFNVKQKQGKRK